MARGYVAAFALATAIGACRRGPHLEPRARHAAPATSASAPTSALLPASGSAPAAAHANGHRAQHIAYAAIGCFTAGSWVEALGAIGEERTLATTRRCRILSTEALGAEPEDEVAFMAARSIDAGAVERVAKAVSVEPELPSLVRAVANAAREASEARRAAEAIRKDPSAKHDDVLVAKQGLAQLYVLKAGKHTATARLVALVLAADHVESSRGLPARAKVLAASPALVVIFGVARPPDPDAWLAYVSSAAKAGGHPATDNSEQSAFAGVVTAFADKFEAMAKELEVGEPHNAAAGYAKRLRTQLSEAAKKKSAKPTE